MKGCLMFFGGLMLLLLLGVGGCTGYMVFKGKALAEDMQRAYGEAARTNQEFPFTSAGAALTEERFADYMDVRMPVAARVQESVDRLKSVSGFRAMFSAMSGMARLFVEVPEILAQELPSRRMSLAEYVWIGERVYGIVGHAADSGNAEATALLDRMVAAVDDNDVQVMTNSGTDPREYGAHLRELARQNKDYTPEELALVLRHGEWIVSPRYGVAADLVLFDTAREWEVKTSATTSPKSPPAESPATPAPK